MRRFILFVSVKSCEIWALVFLSPGKETEGHTLGFWPLTEDTRGHLSSVCPSEQETLDHLHRLSQDVLVFRLL